MKNFILDKAKNENLDYIYFYAEKYNKYNVAKLYKKLLPEAFCKELYFNTYKFLLPITPKGENIVAELLKIPVEIKLPSLKQLLKDLFF